MGGRRKFCGNNSLIVTLIFFYEDLDVNDNHILKGKQYQKRRKYMRTSGLLYFSSNDRFKKEPINFICSVDSGFSKNEISNEDW
jgi:hypothetical protein